ncbi:sigma-70 family RNA polymerase sigma factor [Pseudonocardiaceae bacterium YIM PH 21723]|nr:sigma-70 family RNA polymerase sigma factor [Pseudonocardiaceae bacterium YIM PH 21723]
MLSCGDDFQLVRQSSAMIEEYQGRVRDLSVGRKAALDRLTSKYERPEVLARTGLSPSRLTQLLTAAPRPERALLGTGTVIVALGGKHEAGKDRPGVTISEEDVVAWELLRTACDEHGLKSLYEVIPVGGAINLNRPNLTVICGPRLSPQLAQILESDSNLSFEKDQFGWYLVDHGAGRIHRSPADNGEPADYAYLGRFPRPDGKGHFLYMAGIHATGCAIAAHCLINNLKRLHTEVKKKRFSMLAKGTFDPMTKQVLTSEIASEIYK